MLTALTGLKHAVTWQPRGHLTCKSLRNPEPHDAHWPQQLPWFSQVIFVFLPNLHRSPSCLCLAQKLLTEFRLSYMKDPMQPNTCHGTSFPEHGLHLPLNPGYFSGENVFPANRLLHLPQCSSHPQSTLPPWTDNAISSHLFWSQCCSFKIPYCVITLSL